jgi:hypothetical protein
LEPAASDGRPYDVQFSTDGRHWKTVATNRVDAAWTGPAAGTGRGFYRLVDSRQNGGSK